MGVLRPGQMLEGTSYRVVREIGAGGMGVVYEIEHVRLRKRYVAKTIHDHIRNEDGALKRMEREAQALAAINHPNVVQVNDFGTTTDGVTYFVMEKLDGIDLRQAMRQGGVSRARAIEIVTDVLDALAHVHQRGLVHRDIKPENIFLAESPYGTSTKVLDFGIVHIFDSDGRLSQGKITKTGGFVGTLYYAAPEQMQGKPAGPANDVYATGLVLFELMASKGPFDDDPGVGLSRCFKPAPTLAETAGIPRELSDVVARALQQDPAARPSAGALAAELRAACAALGNRLDPVDDDPIRAEVDDLLRHMQPAPRPAAGRAMTPPLETGVALDAAVPSPARAVTPTPERGIAETESPKTPLMAGAPGRPMASAFDKTMASASSDDDASFPPLAAISDGDRLGARASAGIAPSFTGDGATRAHAPGANVDAPQQGAGAPAHQRRVGSIPNLGGSPRRADTSPGLYATVDGVPNIAVPHAPRTPRFAIAAASGAALLAVLVLGGTLLYTRLRPAPSNDTASSPRTTNSAALPASSPIASTGSVPLTQPRAEAPLDAKPESTTIAIKAPSAAASTTSTSTSSPPSTPSPAAKPVTSPVTNKAATPPPTPRPSTRSAEKDGYLKEL